MRSVRTLSGALGACLALLLSSMAVAAPNSGASTGSSGQRSLRAADSAQSDGEEFVVAFDAAQHDQAMASISAAGGSVLDVTESAGLALVGSSNTAFLDEVRAAPAIAGAASNHSVGTSRPGMPHRFAEERPTTSARTTTRGGGGTAQNGRRGRASEPLADLQWDMAMIGATPDGAWRNATGRGVTVGVIDTGVDASHPDIAPNFSQALSRNFTMDIPSVDGPCEVSTCIDPANVDDGGHGTHVAGIIAGARNGIGIAGVAPDATIVNVRAGQDSGYFFLYETVAALTYAGDAALDVVNMSFYTDPWLYNCESADDYVEGTPTEAEIADQAFIRSTILAALDYATDHGVTLVAAAGNGHADLDEELRLDDSSPDYPPGSEAHRIVTNNCLDLPSEGPDVVSVSAVGPSTTKSDFSNYGFGEVEVSAPGGWFRDGVGTPTYRTPGNLILSSYPLKLAIEEGLANPDGTPADAFSVRSCNAHGTSCGFYTYLQGTSMASPHAAGVAALIVESHGDGSHRRGFSLDPASVRAILLATATDHACPVGGVEIYTDEGRPASWNAICEGTTANNGLYGEGIINATAAAH
jgi:subtilisin family serine protease